MTLPAIVFAVVAVLYACVGFGGGSSYVAFLALFDVPYEDIPQVALVCNIIVVTGGVYHFMRQGHLRPSLCWPFVVASVPCAFLGGRIPVGKEAFLVLLGAALTLAGLRLLLVRSVLDDDRPVAGPRWPVAVTTGGLLGLLSGLVGIGGGIFLSPIMLNLKWATPKQVAATASVFILANSLSGLSGQVIKHRGASDVLAYWPLYVAVLFGGQLGSRLGALRLSQRLVRRLTAALVLLVGIRVLLKAFAS